MTLLICRFFALLKICKLFFDPSGELNFWDKIVYEIALEDYINAYTNGQYNAATRKKFLEENYITTSTDWFMRPEDEMEVKPQGDCYQWIDERVKRKR